MTLDVYADLFDSDLDDVAEALNNAVAEIFEPKVSPQDDSAGQSSS